MSSAILETPALSHLFDLAKGVAASDGRALIVGEPGVGKRTLARWIHARSRRVERPILAFACADQRPHEYDAALFGRGPLSGKNFAGIFESADGGTVVLEEVAAVPMAPQAMLIRFVESGRVTRRGEADERQVDVRVISTTAADLDEQISLGTFRMDLAGRLGEIRLVVPPLRRRPEDVEPLTRHLLAELASAASSPEPSQALLDLFRSVAWPRNVIQLREVLEQGLARCTGSMLTLDHVDVATLRSERPRPPRRDEDAERAALQQRERIIAELIRTGGRALSTKPD